MSTAKNQAWTQCHPDRCLELSPSETSLEFSSHPKEEEERFVPSEVAKEHGDDGYDDTTSILVWELLLYVPIILVQSVFGTFHVLRSLVLGHALRWFLRRQEQQHVFHWENRIPLLTEGKKDWPPPGLIFLASLTIIALVVHPDGFTWVFLRQIRNAIMSLFQASCTCWSMLLHEHGAIISTCVALATFASLFLLAYALHKTLSPRKPAGAPKSSQKSVSNKKKKRKRGHRTGGRSRTAAQQSRSTDSQEPHYTTEQTDDDSVASRSETIQSPTQPVLPAVLEDLPVEPPVLVEKEEEEERAMGLSSSRRIVPRVRTIYASTADDSISSVSVGDQSWDDGRSTPVPLAVPTSCTSSPAPTQSSSPSMHPSSRTMTTALESRTRRNSKPRAPNRTPSNNSAQKNRRRGGGGGGGGGSNVRMAKEHPDRSRPSRHPKINDAESARNIHTYGLPDVVSPPRLTSVTTDRNLKTQFSTSPNDVRHRKSSTTSSVYATAEASLATIRLEPRVDTSMMNHLPQPVPSYYHQHNTPVRPRPPPGLSPIPYMEQSIVAAPKSSHGVLPSPVNLQQTYAYPGAPYPFYYAATPPPPPMTTLPQFSTPDPYSFNNNADVSALSMSPLTLTTDMNANAAFGLTHSSGPRVRANPFATDDDDEILVGGAMRQDTTEEDDRIEAELQELGGRMVGSILDF